MLLAAMDLVHLLEDERFSTPEAMLANGGELSNLIQDVLITRDADQWLATFDSMNVPVRKVATIDEAIRDEQLTINKMIVPPVDDDVGIPMIVNHPIKVSNVEQVGPKRAPEMGEQTSQILQALGYSENEIQKFRDKGVV